MATSKEHKANVCLIFMFFSSVVSLKLQNHRLNSVQNDFVWFDHRSFPSFRACYHRMPMEKNMSLFLHSLFALLLLLLHTGDKGQNKYGKNRQVQSRYANVRTRFIWHIKQCHREHKIPDIHKTFVIPTNCGHTLHHEKFAFHLFSDCQSIVAVRWKIEEKTHETRIRFRDEIVCLVVSCECSIYPIMKCVNMKHT